MAQERKSLRNSMLALTDNNTRIVADMARPEGAAGTVNRLFDRQPVQRVRDHSAGSACLGSAATRAAEEVCASSLPVASA